MAVSFAQGKELNCRFIAIRQAHYPADCAGRKPLRLNQPWNWLRTENWRQVSDLAPIDPYFMLTDTLLRNRPARTLHLLNLDQYSNPTACESVRAFKQLRKDDSRGWCRWASPVGAH